jgi:hypothetical protein
MSFLIIINIVGLLLVIIGVIHLKRCVKEKSGILLATIFLIFGASIMGWAIFTDFLLLIGYRG